MNFKKVLLTRQSTRDYKDEQLTTDEVASILTAGMHAPVGRGQYQNLHITVVQDQAVLDRMCEATWARLALEKKVMELKGEDSSVLPENPNVFFGAPTVIFVSHKGLGAPTGIAWSNAISVVNQMHLEATNLGLGSCYVWGALDAMRTIPALDHTDLLELPEGFTPLCALAVGYPTKPLKANKKQHEISMNRI